MIVQKAQSQMDLLRQALFEMQSPQGDWLGELSSSAVSTSLAAYTFFIYGKDRHEKEIRLSLNWLKASQNPDGGWGDTPESKSNMSAAILALCAFFPFRDDAEFSQNFANAKKYLSQVCDFSSPKNFAVSVLKYYGKDLTFSAPILAVCASSGVLGQENPWRHVPRLPFEFAALPNQIFGFLRLPMVSYAVPALVAVGLAKAKKSGVFSVLTKKILAKYLLKKILKMQPSSGGFLEAAPLTAFCAICLAEAGFSSHDIAKNALEFLHMQRRADGGYPIDWNLRQWLTSLASAALKDFLSDADKEKLRAIILQRQFTKAHPFTGANAGAWGWTNTDGAVPDADDTSGALSALAALDAAFDSQIKCGLEWLMNLQNSDGGMPTFCKGWNLLPFDKSCSDISAHALKAFYLWSKKAPSDFSERLKKSSERLENYLRKNQAQNGSWTSLWFGDQDCPEGVAPVYGTAIVLEHLSALECKFDFLEKAFDYLEETQNADGAWGGDKNIASKNLITARALCALSNFGAKKDLCAKACERLLNFENSSTEAVGLYFSKLWYSEKLYAPILRFNAFNAFVKSRK